MTIESRTQSVRWLVMTAVVWCVTVSAAGAQDVPDRLGGHFGVVFPLVTHVDGVTTNIGDDFKLGFPMGITVKTSEKYAFDLEVVPSIDPQDGGATNVGLTIHPGVLRGLGHAWTAGMRMAFDINGASWGFTPLLNKGFPLDGRTYFVEFVLPIRFQDTSTGDTHTAVTFGVHLGIGF